MHPPPVVDVSQVGKSCTGFTKAAGCQTFHVTPFYSVLQLGKAGASGGTSSSAAAPELRPPQVPSGAFVFGLEPGLRLPMLRLKRPAEGVIYGARCSRRQGCQPAPNVLDSLRGKMRGGRGVCVGRLIGWQAVAMACGWDVLRQCGMGGCSSPHRAESLFGWWWSGGTPAHVAAWGLWHHGRGAWTATAGDPAKEVFGHIPAPCANILSAILARCQAHRVFGRRVYAWCVRMVCAQSWPPGLSICRGVGGRGGAGAPAPCGLPAVYT